MGEDPNARAAEVRLNRLLNLILETAVQVLDFDAATVTTRNDGALSTVCATDQRLLALDQAQYDGGNGPCIEALDAGEVIFVEDASTDDRWPVFRQAADEFGVHTVLSMPAEQVSGGPKSSLNFYARASRPLATGDLRTAGGFAMQVGTALEGADDYRAAVRLAEGLTRAMETRAKIEQAKGILMAEGGIDADEAFQRLVALSQRRNMKLHLIAERIVEARSRGARDHRER